MLDLDALLAAAPAEPPAYEDLLTVPVSTRDLAVVVPEDDAAPPTWWPPRARPARRWCAACASSTATPASRWGRARVSLALRLELADPGRTLTDEEIEAAVARVREALEAAGGRLRA